MQFGRHKQILRAASVLGLAILTFSACEFPYRNLETFKAEADRTETVVFAPIARLYQCFLQNGYNSGWQFLNEADGAAQWWATQQPYSYFGLVDFRRIDASRTRVALYGLPGSDYHYGLAALSFRIEHCRTMLEVEPKATSESDDLPPFNGRLP